MPQTRPGPVGPGPRQARPAPSGRVTRLLESSVYVEDLPRAVAFYGGVLGLAPLFTSEALAAFDAGGGTVLLVFRRGGSAQAQHSPRGTIPAHDGAGPLHLCFAIEAGELPHWEAALADRDIPIEGRMTWPRGGISLYLRDPDGHLLELATPGLWATY